MDIYQIIESVDSDSVTKCVSTLSNPIFIKTSTNFENNLENAHCLLTLPVELIRICFAISEERMWEIIGYMSVHSKKPYMEIDTGAEGIKKEADRLRDMTNGSKKDSLVEATDLLKSLAKTAEEIRDPLRTLLLHSLLASWTAFECLIKDVWIQCLNTFPNECAQPTFSTLTDREFIDGINMKAIQVGLLAKYEFDVSNCLGTLLAPKFDFTSLKGMQKAYEAAFKNLLDVEKIFTDTHLVRLEATRHLMVHRGGVVDNEYLEKTGENVEIGSLVPIDEASSVLYFNTVSKNGCLLLSNLDKYIMKLKIK